MEIKIKERWISGLNEGATEECMKGELLRHLEEIRAEFNWAMDYHCGALKSRGFFLRDNRHADPSTPLLVIHSLQEELHKIALLGGLPLLVALRTQELTAAKIEELEEGELEEEEEEEL